ncbi:MAG: cob(I)yrinic acid a,c-diamide adenosyltransferase [Chloroflexi bacterium]|nr:cob(I)yrinic acid a,c-diamide adenosyltransferase [Chloroflexota bacterium]
MVRKTYTGKGDKGETGLLYGGRVPKDDPQTEAYGAVDEAVSALGLARALSSKERVRDTVFGLQKELFTVGAELATRPDHRDKLLAHFSPVTSEMVKRLEGLIDGLEKEVEFPSAFIIPGDAPASAALDLARTIVRKAERRTVTLMRNGLLSNEEVIRYLNRLSSLIYILARYEEQKH